MRDPHESIIGPMLRRNFCGSLMGAGAIARLVYGQLQQSPAPARVIFEQSNAGKPHAGKVLLACQAHSDDLPLMAAGTVAKLIEEGYTGYLVRATNDDMGDAPGLGTVGSIGDHVRG